MAFFDDLGKKISQAGQSAVQKTKDMTDTVRINGAISEEEKKIDSYYYQIGKLYYAMHKTDYESDFAGMMAALQESEAKIREYRQQLQEIKGTVLCERCGTEVSGDAAFCNACGNPMPKMSAAAVAPNQIRCSGCGAILDKSMRFCTTCGTPVADAVQPPVQPRVQPPVQPPVQPTGIACPNCGTVVEEDMAFCTECGTRVR